MNWRHHSLSGDDDVQRSPLQRATWSLIESTSRRVTSRAVVPDQEMGFEKAGGEEDHRRERRVCSSTMEIQGLRATQLDSGRDCWKISSV